MPKLETLVKEASTPIIAAVISPSAEYMFVTPLTYVDQEKLEPLAALLERDQAYAKLLEKNNLGLMEAKTKAILEHVQEVYDLCNGGFTNLITADELLDQLQILGSNADFRLEAEAYWRSAFKNKPYATTAEVKEIICLYLLGRQFSQ